MVIVIRWKAPTDSVWIQTRVHKASSRTGSYEILAVLSPSTTSFSDPAGTSSHWYKVSFFDGINESSLSEAVQGGASLNYCDLTTLRQISGFSTNEISDADVTALMPLASKFVSRKIRTEVTLERATNGPVDSSNKIFYVKNIPISDTDMDSDVDENDVSVYYGTFDSNRIINYGTAQTITSVDARGGRITMATAPTTTTAEAGVYITYSYTKENIDYENVRMAANYFLAHYCSLKVKGETPNYNMVDAPYIRANVAGSIGLPWDSWKYSYLRTAWEILRDVLGKTSKGIGMSRVVADRADETW